MHKRQTSGYAYGTKPAGEWWRHFVCELTYPGRTYCIIITTAREVNVFRSVCLFTGGWEWDRQILCRGRPASGGRPARRETRPLQADPQPSVLTSNGGHCSGRYASYWNECLLENVFIAFVGHLMNNEQLNCLSEGFSPNNYKNIWVFPNSLANSVTRNIIFQKIIGTCHLLCKRPRCYHSTSKTKVAERIFKLSPVHALVIYLISWIRWIEYLIQLGKTPLNPSCISVKWTHVPVDIVFIFTIESFPLFYSFSCFRTARYEMTFLPVPGEFHLHSGGSNGERPWRAPPYGPNFS